MSTSLRFTTSDLECLPGGDGVRYEIIDGELYVSKAPGWHHQYTSGEIFAALRDWSHSTGSGVVLLAPGVIFAEDDNVIPDVVWISSARFEKVWDEAGHMRAAPDLAIEVLSPGAENEQRDRSLKLKLYSRQGVKEYWSVDWQLQAIQVYRREELALRLFATLEGEDVLTSPLLPGFACPLPGLWTPARFTPPAMADDRGTGRD